MSREILQEIIQRSATDSDFRERLVHSPGDVLSEAGFDKIFGV